MGRHRPKRTGSNGFLTEFSLILQKIEATEGVCSIKALRKTRKETPFIDKAVSQSHVDGRKITILLVTVKSRQRVIVDTDNPVELLDRIPEFNHLMMKKLAFPRTP